MDRASLIIICALAALAIAIAGMLAPDSASGVAGVDGFHPVASLAPSITATIRALDAEQSIVLVSDYCLAPDEIPRGGTALAPDLERILRSGARILLVRSAAGLPRDELRRVGTPVELAWSTVEEVANSIEIIGSLVNRQQAATSLAQKMRETLVSASSPDAPRVLLVIGDSFDESGGLWVIKPNSIHGAVLEAAGYLNAIEQPMRGSPQLSLERLHKIDPDVILHLVSGDGSSGRGEEQLKRDYAALGALQAVRQDRVGRVCQPRILDEGPEMLELVAAIRNQVERLWRGGP